MRFQNKNGELSVTHFMLMWNPFVKSYEEVKSFVFR